MASISSNVVYCAGEEKEVMSNLTNGESVRFLSAVYVDNAGQLSRSIIQLAVVLHDQRFPDNYELVDESPVVELLN